MTHALIANNNKYYCMLKYSFLYNSLGCISDLYIPMNALMRDVSRYQPGSIPRYIPGISDEDLGQGMAN